MAGYPRVLVRLGWRRGADGQVPRIPRVGPDGGSHAGSFIGWTTILGGNADADGHRLGDSWQISDEAEWTYATPTVIDMIKQGHLVVEDPESEYAAFQPEAPSDVRYPWDDVEAEIVESAPRKNNDDDSTTRAVKTTRKKK